MKKQQEQQKTNEKLKVRVDSIIVDMKFQCRDEMPYWRINSYRNIYNNNQDMGALLVGRRSKGFVLLDGFHRLKALKLIGAKWVNVEVTNEVEKNWRWIAAKANMGHGAGLKTKEVRKAFRIFIKTKQNVADDLGMLMTYREIAEHFPAKTYKTIYNWMQEDFPETAKLMSDKGISLKQGKDIYEDEGVYMDRKIINQIHEHLDIAKALSLTIQTNEARKKLTDFFKTSLEDLDKSESWMIGDEDEENPDF